MYKTIIAVGLGGFIGSVLRYLVSRLTAGVDFASLPLGTLTVNVLGCFVLGLLTGLFERTGNLSPELRLLLTTGVCGGFTTFSTFCNEGLALMRGGHAMMAAAYAGTSVAMGVLAAAAGMALGRQVG